MPTDLRVPFSLMLLLALACGHTNFAVAQCDPHWLTGDARPTPGGMVTSSVQWDPDGTGPASSVLVVGGALAAATTTDAGVAVYDGAQWTALGNLARTVTALGVHNGQLYAARESLPNTSDVHVWNGTAWQSIGSATGVVHAMISHGGELILGGFLLQVGGIGVANLAKWNGTAWSAFGGIQGTVRAFVTFQGALYAGGSTLTGGTIAGWNGSAWVAGPSFNGEVSALAVRESAAAGQSFLFAGGAFTSVTFAAQTVPAQRVARFEPLANTWSGVSGGLPGTGVTALLVRAVGINGFELAAGVAGASATQRMWRLSGGVWSALGTLNATPATIAFHANRYTIGMQESAKAVRAWNGTAWLDVLGQGILGTVHAVEPAGNDLVIGGSFTIIDGAPVNHIARGSAGAWTSLGGGFSGGGGLGVLALATAPNGDVLAAGDFTVAGATPANGVARWNGSAWSALGAGLSGGVVRTVLVLPNGDVLAGGDFTSSGGLQAAYAARWNGSQWSTLGLGFNGAVHALALLPNGNIVAGGDFTVAFPFVATRIAELSNGSWQALSIGFNDRVCALAVAPNGDLYVAGRFDFAGGIPARIARRTMGIWSWLNPTGVNADVRALHVHASGDLFVGGDVFMSLSPANTYVFTNLIRVHANGFSQPAGVGGDSSGDAVFDIDAAGGDLVVGGLFDDAGSVIAANVARLQVPCAATAIPYGAGCSGLTAPLVLTALEAPWLGGAWRLRSSTFGPGSFAVRALGFAQLSVPLPPILPGSLPGCVGLVTPDVLWFEIPIQGELTTSTPVPSNPSLVGAQVFEQVLQFESAPGGGLAISSSNAVQLVVGSF